MTIDRHEAKALSDIEEHGCHIIHVFGDEEGPEFSYSVGVERTSNQPELIVTGLSRDLRHWIVNEYNFRVRNGETFEEGVSYSGFLDGHDVLVYSMSKKLYSEYLGWNIWLYGNSHFRVYQMIWPTTGGEWPWDPDASADYKWHIPLLFDTRH